MLYLDIRDFEKLKKAILDVVVEFDGIDLREIVEDIQESGLEIELLKQPSQATVLVGASGLGEAISHALYELRHLENRIFRFRDIYFARDDSEGEGNVGAGNENGS